LIKPLAPKVMPLFRCHAAQLLTYRLALLRGLAQPVFAQLSTRHPFGTE
jgi:hypothetical protein